MILEVKDEWFYFGISLVLLLLHCFTLVFFVALETDAAPFPGRHTARHALNFINLGCSGHEINLLWISSFSPSFLLPGFCFSIWSYQTTLGLSVPFHLKRLLYVPSSHFVPALFLHFPP